MFDWLFGGERENPAKRSVESGQACAKCGQPVPKDNMAFDSGGGRPCSVEAHRFALSVPSRREGRP
jgi:hypothetical protein